MTHHVTTAVENMDMSGTFIEAVSGLQFTKINMPRLQFSSVLPS